MFCKYCGKPQDEDALFCSECGKKIVSDKSQNKPINPDINTFVNKNIQEDVKSENKTLNEDVQATDIQPLLEYDSLTDNMSLVKEYEEDKSPQLTRESFLELWYETNNSTKLLLLVGAVMIIVLFALLMLTLFFPNVRL